MPGGLKITVLGSGTSTGVPTIGCHCDVCTSADPRDRRLRPSILLSYGGRRVLIDVTPDFRAQALRTGIERLDAILFTHEHADHIMGLDDVRPFNFRQRERIPIFASERTMAAIHRSFRYIFDGEEKPSSVPQLESHTLDGGSFDLFGVEFKPVPLVHGRTPVNGYRFGNAAYLTDHSDIPPESLEQLRSWMCCFWMPCATSRTPRTRPSIGPSPRPQKWRPSASFSLIFATTCRMHAPKSDCRRTSAWLMTGWRSKSEARMSDAAHPFRVFRSLEEVPPDFGPSALTIGNFDGVHAGHQAILQRVKETAAERGLKPSVLTFDPHPSTVVAPARAPRLMTTPAERAELMRQEGIEQVLILPFDRTVAQFSPEQFVERVLVEKLGVRALLVGHDFLFGHKQAGNVQVLRELGDRYGFTTEEVKAVRLRGHLISSTALRQYAS